MPYLIHTMFWVGVWMPIGAIVFVIAKLIAGDAATFMITGHEVTTQHFSVGFGVVPLAVAVLGVVLAYGIWAQRVYPRYLVMAILITSAVWLNVQMFRTMHISWTPIAAAIATVTAVRYLARNPDVVEYYNRRR